MKHQFVILYFQRYSHKSVSPLKHQFVFKEIHMNLFDHQNISLLDFVFRDTHTNLFAHVLCPFLFSHTVLLLSSFHCSGENFSSRVKS